jgi:hypothetical protein
VREGGDPCKIDVNLLNFMKNLYLDLVWAILDFSLVPSPAAHAHPGFAPLLRDSSSVHLVSCAADAGLIYFLLLPSKACGLI